MKFLILFLNFLHGLSVKNYTLSVKIQDRYVKSEVGVKIENNGTEAEEYNFGINLNQNEFISKLKMKIGRKVTFGKVYEKEKAKKIYENAKQRGENTALPGGSKIYTL